MNNGKETQNEKIENLLRKARLPKPSTELKERVTAEARRVWTQTSVELSWRIPVRRLIASAAAAVFIIWLANFSSDCSVARWQTGETSATSQQPSELDVLPELPYSPFVRHLTSANRKLPTSDASGLCEYLETVRRLLDETQQDSVSQPPDPAGSKSRLLPDRWNPSSYS